MPSFGAIPQILLIFLLLGICDAKNQGAAKGKIHHQPEHSEEKATEEESLQLYLDSKVLPPESSHFYHEKLNGHCQDFKDELFEQQTRLIHVKDTLLEGIECGDENCTKILILSNGTSALRHPPRFGLYNLNSVYEGYPVYSRAASGQSLFFKKEYDKWEYAHRIERWIIGPIVGDASGGLTFLKDEKCPWRMKLKDIEIFFYDKKVSNIWNPRGNGWKLESSERITIECYNPDKTPPFWCGCQTVNLTSNHGGRISQYHPQRIGIYHLDTNAAKLGFLAPVFKREGSNQYLYSHHPMGHLWLVGQSYTTWALRLNLLKIKEEKRPSLYCPFGQPPKGSVWEYLQSKNGEDEIWLKDDSFRIKCIKKDDHK